MKVMKCEPEEFKKYMKEKKETIIDESHVWYHKNWLNTI